jgi:hypothetical protein
MTVKPEFLGCSNEEMNSKSTSNLLLKFDMRSGTDVQALLWLWGHRPPSLLGGGHMPPVPPPPVPTPMASSVAAYTVPGGGAHYLE